MDTILQWAISIQTMVMLWLLGNKDKRGTIVGLAGQVLWIWYVTKTAQWGLFPGVIVFTLIHARNCWKMYKE